MWKWFFAPTGGSSGRTTRSPGRNCALWETPDRCDFRVNSPTPPDTSWQRKTATTWGLQSVAVSCVVELGGLRRVSHQIRQSPFKSRTWKKHYKAPLCPVHRGRLKSVPPECDPQCDPCQSTLLGAFADAGSIPHRTHWPGQIEASRLPYSTTTRLNPSSTNEGMESGAGNIKLFKVLFACRP